MITPLLEKAIIKGEASYKRYAHAFGSFGAIPVPDNALMIITDIKWFPFLDPVPVFNPVITPPTWRRLFRFNEYQLKIDGNISKNYLQFRNEFKFEWFGAIDPAIQPDLDFIVDPSILQKYFLPVQGRPIIENVFFPCERFIKLTITRQAYIENIAEIVGLLETNANEQPAPEGVQDVNVLKRADLTSAGGQKYFYYPPSFPYAANSVTSGRKKEAYTHDIDKDYSPIQKIGTLTTLLTSDFIFQCTPLVELGIVTINKAYFDKIKNS